MPMGGGDSGGRGPLVGVGWGDLSTHPVSVRDGDPKENHHNTPYLLRSPIVNSKSLQ